jgi:hypothetical protein
MPVKKRHAQPERWIVSWSERQKCFHVETVEEMLLRNRDNFERHTGVDFVPLCIEDSIKDANKAVEEYRRMRGIPLLQDQIPESTR